MKRENKVWKLLSPAVVLVGICIVVTAALALTNQITAPIIAAQSQGAADAAKQVVLPAGADFQDVEDLSALPESVLAASQAGNGAGYVFTVNARGYGGDMTVMLGIGADGKIAGSRVLTNNETPSIGGTVVADGSPFQQQLIGMGDVSGIEATSGATVSSNGMKSAVQTAFDAYTLLTGGTVETKLGTAPEGFTAEDAAEYFPGAAFTEVPGGMISDAGTIVYGEAQGMESIIRVAVFFDNDGNILAIETYTKRETEYFGEGVGENSAFTDQFKGVTDVNSVEAVSGATITSNAVKDAVKQAIANLDTVKGAA
ncbi:MAG TPA: FMN-binding protein [Pseudoflavonifractor sp.]|nr:FMN-binding protein [Pseudoflavonifractor sp.]